MIYDETFGDLPEGGKGGKGERRRGVRESRVLGSEGVGRGVGRGVQGGGF